MLAIIFGAGASYDALPSYPAGSGLVDPFGALREARLPLADQLFENRAKFAKIRQSYPACLPIIPFLQNRSSGDSVEQVLESLQVTEPNYQVQRLRQMAAIRFYLQSTIWSCESELADVAQGVTNHLTLFGLVEEYRRDDKPISLITFNYDRLIENALKATVDFKIVYPNDYICRGPYKLFKLHGSIDWGNEINLVRDYSRSKKEEIIEELIRRADLHELADDIQIVDIPPAYIKGNKPLFPSISIPTQKKTTFACPETHLSVLKENLKPVTKLLVIGWRGGERHFLDVACRILKKPLNVAIVSDTLEGATETRDRLGSLV